MIDRKREIHPRSLSRGESARSFLTSLMTPGPVREASWVEWEVGVFPRYHGDGIP
jgi:hypothetical protein